MSDRLKDVPRRQFLQTSAAALGVVATGKWAMLRDAIARARETQKPVLSEAAMSAYLQKVRSGGTAAQLAFLTAVKSDVRAFLRNNFTLTTAQDKGVTAFTSTDISTIANAATRGFTARNEFNVRFATTSTTNVAAPNCAITAKKDTRLQDGVTSEVWTVSSVQYCPYGAC